MAFSSVPILFACHFLSHLVFFVCHRNLICYPLPAVMCCCSCLRPWPPLERQQSDQKFVFCFFVFFPFFFLPAAAARTRTEACWLPSVALFRLLYSTPWCWGWLCCWPATNGESVHATITGRQQGKGEAGKGGSTGEEANVCCTESNHDRSWPTRGRRGFVSSRCILFYM